MPNPKAISLDDALAAVTTPASKGASLDDALAQAQKPKSATFSRLPDPEGAFALNDLATENPKAAIGGAVAGMMAPSLPAVAGTATRAAAAAATALNPDLVGLISPRLAAALRIAQQAVEASKRVAASGASKMNVNSVDFIRIKSLIEQGIPQSEAVRTVMNLRVQGRLP